MRPYQEEVRAQVLDGMPREAAPLARLEPTQLAPSGGSVAATAADHTQASIRARYQVAIARPRDWDDVRARLLKHCQRVGFAEAARYSKPAGGDKKIEGLSVRFAETAIQCMGNIASESFVVHDDEEKMIIRVTSTDIENNVTYTQDVAVQKTVERSSLQKGQVAISTRTNSRGYMTYTVRALEDDMINKINSNVSKAIRSCGLKHLPHDIKEDAINACKETMQQRDRQDPAAAKKKLLDAFGKMNVMPTDISKYLGHATEHVTPKELDELRGVYAALQEGETNWPAVLAAKLAERDESAGSGSGTQAPASGSDAAVNRAREKVAAAVGARKKTPGAAPQQPHASATPAAPIDPADDVSLLHQPPDDYDPETGETR